MSDAAQFEIMRFQIMAFAMSEPGQTKISDAYLYAWDRKVYPYFDEGAEWHVPFEDNFKISGDQISDVMNYLCDKRDEGKLPSFYEMEDHYKVRQGGSEWDRSTLIAICRYMFLGETLDAEFWTALLKPTDHPTEASNIVRPLDRDRDTYFN